VPVVSVFINSSGEFLTEKTSHADI